MVAIGVDQSLCNTTFFEHICMENIKKIYKTVGKCDDHQQCKAILEAAMVSTPEVFNYNSTMIPNQYESTENNSAKKSLRQF